MHLDLSIEDTRLPPKQDYQVGGVEHLPMYSAHDRRTHCACLSKGKTNLDETHDGERGGLNHSKKRGCRGEQAANKISFAKRAMCNSRGRSGKFRGTGANKKCMRLAYELAAAHLDPSAPVIKRKTKRTRNRREKEG